jgi:hypothetical protein
VRSPALSVGAQSGSWPRLREQARECHDERYETN